MEVLFISIPIQTHKHLWDMCFKGKVITWEGKTQPSFQVAHSFFRYVNILNQVVDKSCWPAEPFSVTLHICCQIH